MSMHGVHGLVHGSEALGVGFLDGAVLALGGGPIDHGTSDKGWHHHKIAGEVGVVLGAASVFGAEIAATL